MLGKLKQKLKDQRGLTLVELLAVVVILGIIAAIAVPSIGNIIAKSKFDASKADAIMVLNGAELYMTETGETNATDLNEEKLKTYVKDVKALTTWSVAIDDGVPKITATSTGKTKGGSVVTWTSATKDTVNKTTYETGIPTK